MNGTIVSIVYPIKIIVSWETCLGAENCTKFFARCQSLSQVICLTFVSIWFSRILLVRTRQHLCARIETPKWCQLSQETKLRREEYHGSICSTIQLRLGARNVLTVISEHLGARDDDYNPNFSSIPIQSRRRYIKVMHDRPVSHSCKFLIRGPVCQCYQ